MPITECTSKSRIVATLALLATALPAITLSANKTPQLPQIRVSTRLVQIGVIARDKNGPVANLTKDDFVVLDQQTRRDISVFSAESPTNPSLPAERTALPPNTFSDLPEYGAATPSSVTILLLDNLNTLYGSAPESRFEAQPYWLEDLALQNAKTHLIQFIRQLQPQDRVAIYSLRHSLHVLCDFTGDRQTLLTVLAKYDTRSVTNRAVVEPGLKHAPIKEADAFENEASASLAGSANEQRAIETMAALRQIAAHVANIPGRKNLVWLTANLPFSAAAMAGILSPAQIAAYPIDARGLLARTVPAQPGEGTYTLGSGPGAVTDGAAPAQSSEPIGIASMELLASETGGQAFVNTNDLTGAIRRAVEDSAVTYTLGFYVGPDSIDGKFHTLKIAVKRKGVTLRYPRGYFAFKDTPATKDENRDNFLAAAESPIESSTIPVHVRIERVQTPLPHCLSIFGAIDVGKLQFAQNAGVRRGAASVVTIEQDETGQVVAQSASTIAFHFSAKQYADYLRTGFPFHQFVQPSTDTATLRIIVEDTSAAEVGSLIISLSEIK